MANRTLSCGQRSHIQLGLKRTFAASTSVLALSLLAQPVAAQTASADEIVVTGSRQVIQDAIALKRDNAQIVDGLSADEIGDIPALSIGEALENITGVASHRENGGATEVSIRGLGPFLSSTVVNGRAATNGSGDRSVNFSQFPSELVNKLAVFKTQDATQIEGGVAGQIQIETIKPLDFGKRRVQFDVKGNVNPDQLKQDDTEAGDFGYRLTGSYTDQFEVGGGDIGFSVGAQFSDISQPEAESRQTGVTSNSRPACVISNGLARFTDQTNGGTFTGFSNNPETTDRGDDDCDDFNDRRNAENLDTRGSDTEGFDTAINANGLRVDGDVPFVFAPSQRSFRQNDTRDRRDAIFGALQFQPNDRWDINLDAQWSERTQTEQRNDLTFNGGRRNDTSLNIGPGGSTTTLDSLQFTNTGAILRSITDNSIEIGGGNWQREETYTGFGANVEFQVTDRLTVEADYGYSNTRREENNQEYRLQSDISPVIEFDRTEGIVPVYRLFDEEFDVNNFDNYVDRLRVRIDNDVERENTINAFRFDTNYDLGNGFFKGVTAGFRWAEQTYFDATGGTGVDSGDPLSTANGRFSFEIENDGELTVNNREVLDDNNDSGVAGAQQQLLEQALVGIIGSTRDACRTEFPEGNSFLSSVREGDLITNIADDGTVLSATNSFATLDSGCVAETSVNSLNSILDQINAYSLNPDARENSFGQALNAFSAAIPGAQDNLNTIDVTETTTAFYLQTNYEAELDGVLPISGHLGARIVRTTVDSVGFRSALNVTTDDEGGVALAFAPGLEQVSTSNSYTRILPSATAILEVAEDKLVRLGAFRAMSRADPADLGFGRDIDVGDEDDAPLSIQELISGIGGSGNPELDPLMSWNFDAGFEWYPNADSIFAVGAYFKQFQGGFNNVIQEETFEFNGAEVLVPVSGIQQTSDNKSNLFGVEVTAAHAFTYLPGLLSGLGAKLSYNYATSDFEFEDSRYGDIFVEQPDGSLVQTNSGIVAPANLPGLSENVFSGEVYWGQGPVDLSVRYKYRDNYFQPFTSDGTRIRYVNDVGVWEARAAYKINDNFRLTAEAINIFSEPRSDSGFVLDDVYLVNDYGPRIFFGLRGRF